MKLYLLFGLPILLPLLCSQGARADVVLVRKGRPTAHLVVAADAAAPERFAAEEIQRYVEQISGARLPLVGQAPKKSLAVYVGRGPWFSVATNPDAWEDSFTLRVSRDRVLVAGDTPRGTLYAAYALLERLGCRWIAPNFSFYPGGKGEILPRLDSLALSEGEIRQRPAWRYRAKYVEEGRTHTAENLPALVDWMAKNRLNVFSCPTDYGGSGQVRWDVWREALTPQLRKRGLLVEVGGHGYQNFLPSERYFGAHPEWFGLEGGQRTAARNRVFCTSDPEALAELTRNVLAYLRDRPEIDIFDLWPPDGARWCECSACTALGAPTLRHARVVNHVAAALAGELPQLILEFIAYSSYLDPPPDITFASNTLVGFCPIARSFATTIDDPQNSTNKRYWDALAAWLARPDRRGRLYIYSYFRRYAWRSLPVLLPELIGHDVASYRAAGAMGMSSYSEPGDWLTYEVQHLALARSSWEKDFQAGKFLTAYCRDRFGLAEKPMRRFFELVESIVPQACAIPGTSDPGPEALGKYLESLSEAKKSLDEGARLLVTDLDRRVLIERLGVALEYARLDIMHRADPKKRALRELVVALLKAHSDDGLFVSPDWILERMGFGLQWH